MRARLGWVLLAALLCATSALSEPVYPPVLPNRPLVFPRDYGAHPEFRTEWWYVTGWLEADGAPLGFQITFFRVRPGVAEENPSRFSLRQILIAHAALSDPRIGHLLKDEKISREGFGLAAAQEGATSVWVADWSLKQNGPGYVASIAAREFRLKLRLTPTQPPLLQGDQGYSRKGRNPLSASYYYSFPQLAVSGTVTRGGRIQAVSGTAWLDHEWSSEYLEPDAVGWDWTGINFADGGALMAFRMRDRAGKSLWAGGSYRAAFGKVQTFTPQEVRFMPLKRWRSPRTGIDYPVQWRLQAGDVELTLVPLLDDQENDARASTGAIYWEGAVRAIEKDRTVGRGYLELTGYGEPLRLP